MWQPGFQRQAQGAKVFLYLHVHNQHDDDKDVKRQPKGAFYSRRQLFHEVGVGRGDMHALQGNHVVILVALVKEDKANRFRAENADKETPRAGASAAGAVGCTVSASSLAAAQCFARNLHNGGAVGREDGDGLLRRVEVALQCQAHGVHELIVGGRMVDLWQGKGAGRRVGRRDEWLKGGVYTLWGSAPAKLG